MRLCHQPAQKLINRQLLRSLVTLTSGKRKIAINHFFHLANITADGFGVFIIGHQGQLKTHASQWGTQIMANAGKHFGALIQLPHDAIAHCLKGAASKPNLARPFKPVIGGSASKSKLARRCGQTVDWAHLSAKKHQGNAKQNDRTANCPTNKGPAC